MAHFKDSIVVSVAKIFETAEVLLKIPVGGFNPVKPVSNQVNFANNNQ